MRRVLIKLLLLLLVVIFVEVGYYFYLIRKKPVSFPKISHQEKTSQIESSLSILTINNLHPQLKLTVNLPKEEIEKLITAYGKSKVEIRVVAREDDVPIRPQGASRGVGTYIRDKGKLVLAYSVWSEYLKNKAILYLYLNPEVFLDSQRKGERPEAIISQMFLYFLANNHYAYLLPEGKRIVPRKEDIKKYVEEKPLFSLKIKL